MSGYSWSSPQEKREWMLDFTNLTEWHNAGFTGEGINIYNHELNTEHAEMTNDVLRVFAPDAYITNGKVRSSYMDGVFTHFYFELENGDTYSPSELKLDLGIDLMSVSFAGGGAIQKEQEKVLQQAIDEGLIVFCAAGNDGSKGTSGKYENVAILIGAIYPYKNEDGVKLTYYSSYNETTDQTDDIDFVAFMGNGSGTSAACPCACAMGAVWLQFYRERYNKNLTQEELKEVMKKYCRDVGEDGKDNKHGYGLLVMPKLSEIIEEVDMEFKDVDSNHWANLAIQKSVKKEIFKGYEDETFRPDENMTRAQMCVVLDRLGLLD